MPPVALIDRVEAAVAGIAHTQAAPANAADQQADAESEDLVPGSALNFLVRVERSFIVVENKTNRQSEVQLTFVRLVDLASVQARADDVQLCLSERALHAEHKAVVELGSIVTTLPVDHDHAGVASQL